MQQRLGNPGDHSIGLVPQLAPGDSDHPVSSGNEALISPQKVGDVAEQGTLTSSRGSSAERTSASIRCSPLERVYTEPPSASSSRIRATPARPGARRSAASSSRSRINRSAWASASACSSSASSRTTPAKSSSVRAGEVSGNPCRVRRSLGSRLATRGREWQPLPTIVSATGASASRPAVAVATEAAPSAPRIPTPPRRSGGSGLRGRRSGEPRPSPHRAADRRTAEEVDARIAGSFLAAAGADLRRGTGRACDMHAVSVRSEPARHPYATRRDRVGTGL